MHATVHHKTLNFLYTIKLLLIFPYDVCSNSVTVYIHVYKYSYIYTYMHVNIALHTLLNTRR